MTTLGVAVLGCGFQGAIHGRNIVESSNAELVACVDVDPERADSLSRSLGGVRTAAVSEVWSDPRVDAVIIATTTNTHHELALMSARSGKHMLIEKPMALTVEQCLEVEEACESAGVVAVVGYKFRFTAAVAAARAAIAEPIVLTAHTLYDPAPAGSHAWVDDPALSGGRLVSSLVHSVDLLRHMARDEVVRVFAEGSSTLGTSQAPDTATATLRFRRGAVASVVHGTAAASGLVSTWSFQVADNGSNATIHDHGRRLLLHRAGEFDREIVDPAREAFEAGTTGLLDAFVDRVAGAVVEAPGPRDGTLSLLVSRCIEDSIASSQPVDVPSL